MCCVSLVLSEWTIACVFLLHPQGLTDLGHSQSFSGSNWWLLIPTEGIKDYFEFPEVRTTQDYI